MEVKPNAKQKQKEVKLGAKQLHTLRELLRELVEKQQSYVNGLTAHFHFIRHPMFEKLVISKKYKWHEELQSTINTDLSVLSALLFAAKELLRMFTSAHVEEDPTHKIDHFLLAMESKVLEMFLTSFSMATQRYEEINIHLTVAGPMKKLYSQKIPKVAQALKHKLEKHPSHDTDSLTLEDCNCLAQDGYNPWIRTIQRAVQLRSFLERLVIETMIPKAMLSKKKSILTIKGYTKQTKSIKNPNDDYAKKLIRATEHYRERSMNAEKQFSSAEESLQRIKDAAKCNAKGLKLMKSNKNMVDAKTNFSKAVHKDGSQYQYHLHLGEACHILGFYRDASGAFLQGIKLRAGQDLLKNTRTGKQELESKIKELTAQYQADLEDQKDRNDQQAKVFTKQKKELTTKVDALKSTLEKTFQRIKRMEAEAKKRDQHLVTNLNEIQQLTQQLKQKNVTERQKKTQQLAHHEAEVQKIKQDKTKCKQELSVEKKTLAKVQIDVKKTEKKLGTLNSKIEKANKSMACTAEALNNFNNTVAVCSTVTMEAKEDSDEEEEVNLRQENVALKKKVAELEKLVKDLEANLKKRGAVTTTRVSIEKDEKAELLSFLAQNRLFSGKIALKQSNLTQLMEACPKQILYGICRRFSRQKNLSKSIEELLFKLKRQVEELTRSQTEILTYLQGTTCQLWANGVPNLTSRDMESFELHSDQFFAFLGPVKVEGEDRYTPFSLLQSTPTIFEMARGCIIGLKRMDEKKQKFTTIQEVVTSLKAEHNEEVKNQDNALDDSRQPQDILKDFFGSGVGLFAKDCRFEEEHVKKLLQNNSGAMVRRKLEQIVLKRLLFDSVEELIDAVSSESYPE